jgi:hypothetical protein
VLNVTDADFGISPDATDNAAGLQLLHRRLLSDQERMWEVEFPPGTYRFSWGDWLESVGRVRVHAHGASFQSLTDQMLGHSNCIRPLLVTETGWATVTVPGHRFRSVDEGIRQITLLDASAAADFAAGVVVMLAGFNQQVDISTDPPRWAGWPPNHRFFEFGLVESVDQTACTVTLRHPLRHTYDELWPDYQNHPNTQKIMSGAPRVWPCDRPGYHIVKHLEIHGATFLRPLATDAARVSMPSSLYTLLADCTIRDPTGDGGKGGQFSPSMAAKVELKRCTFDRVEVDKQVERLLVECCEIGELTSRGAGCEMIDLQNSRFHGSVVVYPRGIRTTACYVNGRYQFESTPYMKLPFAVNAEGVSLL